MKNIKIFSLFFILSVLFFGCEKELETDDISRITTYPEFTLNGEKIMATYVGAGFTDPGVVAKAGSETLEVTTSVRGAHYIVPGQTQPSQVQYTNTLDLTKPGIYTITYSATNEDGFSGTTTRTVFVLDKKPDPTVDLSGTYKSGSSPTATITKIADGVFYSSNAWGGGSGVVIPAYILTSDGVNLNVPQQESLVRIFGYGTRAANGTLNLKMSRPTFTNPGPLIDLVKDFVKI